MSTRIVMLALVLALAGCADPPCASDEAARKAGEMFGHCVRGYQGGQGGYRCGETAYETYCRKVKA